MLRLLPCLLLFAAMFAGCAEPSDTADLSATGEAVASAGSSDVGNSVAGGTKPKCLSVPDGVSPQQARDYLMICDMASTEDPNSMANLGFVTLQFAFGMAESGKKDEVIYPFFKQAANGFRVALAGGVAEIPSDMLSQAFYFESVAHGSEGDIAASIASLDDAFKNGFTEIGYLLEDDALAKVRASDQWASKFDEWVKEMLSGSEEFTFALTETSVDGVEVALEQLKGKVVIVDFWGTWCPPCRAEIPSFIKLQKTYGDDGLQMIGVNYESAATQAAMTKLVTDYIAENGINYPCVLGDDDLKNQVPGFRSYPTTLFIDRAGNVRHVAVGQHSYEYLEIIVSHLLSEE